LTASRCRALPSASGGKAAFSAGPREGAPPLRVTASPMDDIPVGASAWLKYEPRQMALIA
jgi:hypothetical protein